jgi:hypothetical protein
LKHALIFLCAAILLNFGEARAQQPGQEKSGPREQPQGEPAGPRGTPRVMREGRGLAADNLERVAAAAEQILEILNRDAGLMVEFKRMTFRSLTPEEDRQVVEAIERSRADIVWVGLGAPKQDRWMFAHRERLSVPVLIGVGAAFDFHTGRVPRAPVWMRENGFEWLFRLLIEPRRLWKRYLVYGLQFVILVALELLGLKKFS